MVLQHQGPVEEMETLGKIVEMISDYQDEDGFNTDDALKNISCHFDIDNADDPLNLERFFIENKYSILEEHRDFLENVATSGMIKKFRRQYWLAITGAYGYLNHYSDGYYAALSSEN